MLHSSFKDAYMGRKYDIRISSHTNGFTAELIIEGLPPHQDSDNLWKTRDEAINAMSNDARRIIEGLHD